VKKRISPLLDLQVGIPALMKQAAGMVFNPEGGRLAPGVPIPGKALQRFKPEAASPRRAPVCAGRYTPACSGKRAVDSGA